MKTTEYFKNNQMAVDVFNTKYAFTKEDGIKESVLEVFQRVARILSQYEKEPKKWEKIWTDDMMEGWYRPGGSIINGVGNKNKISLANCTTIPLKEDSIESINECMNDMMLCASKRQGLGVDGSVLRPRGAKVNNSAEESTGVVPWLDYLQSMGLYVGQKGRLPAILLSIKDYHPDIFEFITCKEDLDKLTNANISVQISDKFMNAVKADADWELSFSTQHEAIKRTVKAREIFDLIAKSANKTAEPGVQFIDAMRAGSLIHAIYTATGNEKFKIISTNACSEKSLAAYGCCMLASLNMGKFPTTDYESVLKEKTFNLTRLIDNAISYEIDNNRYGVDDQKDMMLLTRELGLGITNLHQWFINKDIQYDSDEAAIEIEQFMKLYAYNAIKASQQLAIEKEPCLAYAMKDTSFTHQDLMQSSFFANIVNEFYQGDPSQVTPLRNLAFISIAPAGTISLTFQDACLSTGVEPIFGPAWWKKTRAISKGVYDHYFVFPGKVKEYLLQKIRFSLTQLDLTIESDEEFIMNVNESTLDNGGELGEEVQELIQKYLGEGFFKPAYEIDPIQKVKMMGRIYKWVDAAVSVTYNLPFNTTDDIVQDIYQKGWENGVRAMSVYREGSRAGILLFDSPAKIVGSKEPFKGQKDIYCSSRPDSLVFNCAPKRTREMPCEIHHCKVQGNDWLVLVGLHKGYPYEIFAGEENKEEMYVPQTVKEGLLRKDGAKYSLIIPIRRTEVEYKDIADAFMNEQYRSLTRMISLSLRHGVRPAFITDQLKKANEGITEFSSVVSRVLNKYMKQLDYEYLNNKRSKDECPSCGSTDWYYEGGCAVCANCRKGKCD